MKIARFGATWAGGYALSQIEAEDEIPTQRAPVFQAVAGSGGAFDPWADTAWPWSAITVKKSFALTAASYAAWDTAYDALLLATLGASRTKLWLEGRDGSTHRWAWAKAIAVSKSEKPAQGLKVPVVVEWFVPEGVWYAESQSTASRTGAGTVACSTNGNVRALVTATIATGATNPGLAIGAGPPIWAYTGVTSGSGLVVNASTFAVTQNGSDAFANLSYGPGGTGQLEFFWLPPGSNTVTVSMTGSVLASLAWYDTFLM